MFSVCLSEAQPVYIGVPASHRRKRRRHHSYASDRITRHTPYDHHTQREHSHQGYYHDREEHFDDDEGSMEHHEHLDPSGQKLLLLGVFFV